MAGNDKCVRDACKYCCYCGAELKGDGYYQVQHVDPPSAPMCPRSDEGHVPLVFATPKQKPLAPGVWGINVGHPPPTAAIVGGLLAVRLCKLCGLVYWEPIEKPKEETP
jgi:hypothetical protein